jgi:hypothetical protein
LRGGGVGDGVVNRNSNDEPRRSKSRDLLSGLLNLRTANGHGRLRDDALSVVLSKAFPLAADDEIKDASIRQQIRLGESGA